MIRAFLNFNTIQDEFLGLLTGEITNGTRSGTHQGRRAGEAGGDRSGVNRSPGRIEQGYGAEGCVTH